MESIGVRFEKITTKILDGSAVILMAVIMTIIIASVAARVTGAFGMDWFEEIVGLGLTWMVLIKAALLFKDKDHLQVDALSLLVSKNKECQKIYNIFIDTITFLSLVGFAIISFALCYTTRKSSPMLGFTFKLWYVSMCVSSVLSSIYVSMRLMRELRA